MIGISLQAFAQRWALEWDSAITTKIVGGRGEVVRAKGRRFVLVRSQGWPPPANNAHTVAFVGVNPSNADAASDDHTVRRCWAYAKRDGAAHLVMLNLCAVRSTDPVMLVVEDRMSDSEHAAVAEVARAAHRVVVAWGVPGGESFPRRIKQVLGALGDAPLWCLGCTKAGHPRHPSRLASVVAFEPWP